MVGLIFNIGSKKRATSQKGSQKRIEHSVARDKGKMVERKDESEGFNKGRFQIGVDINKIVTEQK